MKSTQARTCASAHPYLYIHARTNAQSASARACSMLGIPTSLECLQPYAPLCLFGGHISINHVHAGRAGVHSDVCARALVSQSAHTSVYVCLCAQPACRRDRGSYCRDRSRPTMCTRSDRSPRHRCRIEFHSVVHSLSGHTPWPSLLPWGHSIGPAPSTTP